MENINGDARKRQRRISRLKYQIVRWRNKALGSRQRQQIRRRAIYKFIRRCASKKLLKFFLVVRDKLVQLKLDVAAEVICNFLGRLRERKRIKQRCQAMMVIQRFFLSAHKVWLSARKDGSGATSECGKYPLFDGVVLPRLKEEVRRGKKFRIKHKLPGASNLVMFTYDDAGDTRMFGPGNKKATSIDSALVRMEMRSFVVNYRTGVVHARTLPKFLTPGGPMSRRWKVLKGLYACEVTEKRDGSMIFGVLVNELGCGRRGP